MMRRRLPNRRASLTFEIDSQELRFTRTASRFPGGSLAEIFFKITRLEAWLASTRRIARLFVRSPCGTAPTPKPFA